MKKSILSGNLDDQVLKHPETKGWFVGSFMDKFPEFKSDTIELKWIKHEKGFHKPGSTSEEKINNISILIYGKFNVVFPESSKEILLEKQGDYVFFDISEGSHYGEALEDSLLMVVRYKE